MSFSIAGKTAIVTGAANGVGLAVARHFADHGANVVCADVDEKGLVAAFGNNPESEEGDGDAVQSNTRIFAGDLREKLTIANLLSVTIDAFDRVDILVNASRMVETCEALDIDDKTVEELLDQNLMTSLKLTRLVAKRMIAQGAEAAGEEGEQSDTPLGAIVNLSSIASGRTQPRLLAFSISSAAIEQMTRSMAVALAPHRIRINAVSFGSVMSASMMGAIKSDPGFRDHIVESTPLGRIAEASEVAETARFLASEGAGFMTGQVLTVDGGRTLVDPVRSPIH